MSVRRGLFESYFVAWRSVCVRRKGFAWSTGFTCFTTGFAGFTCFTTGFTDFADFAGFAGFADFADFEDCAFAWEEPE